MFRFVGKLAKEIVNTAESILISVREIPKDLVEGYNEGFKSTKEITIEKEKTVEPIEKEEIIEETITIASVETESKTRTTEAA